MPTGAGSDLLPVRKATKRELAQLKGSATYDATIRALLDTALPEAVRARLQRRPAQRKRAPRAPPSAWRDPEKQRLIADLAAESWKSWRREGRVVDLGPRMVAWRTSAPSKREVNSIGSPSRRGFAP